MAIHFTYHGVENFLNVLREQKRRAEQDGFDLLAFSQVEFDFLRRHELMIERQKIRIFEYAPDKQQLIIKMPIRAIFAAQGMIFRYLTEQMTKVGMEDDDWMLLNGGDFQLENGCTVEPDLALYCMAGGKGLPLFPHIVFEIGISQSVEDLRSRAEYYIRHSIEEINAVICLHAPQNQSHVSWAVYKAFRPSKQDQDFKSVICGDGLISFDKYDGSGELGLPANITTTGPMTIPIGKGPLGTPDDIELIEEALVKITEKLTLRRWQW
ncbi:hypothetical protein N7507_007141 [Penicillium longicatenatum]|nr:hypothetical protein N7507_007141 [Penicillium longicatenatum]